MKIEDIKCTSLKLAKELKANGYKQKGLWFYDLKTNKLQQGFTSHIDIDGFCRWSIVAPTVAELGEALPRGTSSFLSDTVAHCTWNHRQVSIDYLSEADVRAKLWLHLKKEKLI